MLLLTNEDVVNALSMEECMAAVEESLRRLARGKLVRWDGGTTVELTETEGFDRFYSVRFLPVLDLVDATAVCRLNSWVSVTVEESGTIRQLTAPLSGSPHSGGQKTGYPTGAEKTGWLLLFDMKTGQLLSLIQDRDIQVMRVGSGGGINAKYLARADAQSVGLIGAGWMARALLVAYCVARDIKTVRVYSPNPRSRNNFSDDLASQLGIKVTAASSAEEAVRGADIVVSATNATEPTFDPDWVEQGTHVHCITGAEYDERLLKKADVISWIFRQSSVYDNTQSAASSIAPMGDDPQAAKLAARKRGEFSGYRLAGTKLLEKYADKRVYLTDLVEGRAVGRRDDKQITLSPSPAGGSTLQMHFAALVPKVFRGAKRKRIGHELPDEWFQQQTNTYPAYRLK
jgi:alanine dehydrogenase